MPVNRYQGAGKLFTATTLCAFCFLCISLFSPLFSPFGWSMEEDAARIAAAEGRHDEVVKILTQAIESGQLPSSDLGAAHTNRGIAYSLLGSYEKAQQDLQRATTIDPDNEMALHQLGILAEVYERDLERAVHWYKLAATKGFPNSQVSLGQLYKDGRGIERNYTSAFYWFQQAATHEYTPAYAEMGRMYWYGRGVDLDAAEAVKLFQQAAAGGSDVAAYYIGVAYEYGRGIERSPEKAAASYEKAAVLGYSDGQNALGYLYRRGLGVTQNLEQAVKWYQLAAEQDHPKALNRLAWILANCPQARFCDGARALLLAKQSLAIESSLASLDTLAAAYARVGRFEEAIVTMNRIIAIAPKASANVAKYKKRLAGYQAGQPSQL